MPSAYDSLILSETGLTHYWKLDEAFSFSTAIDSVGSFHGTNSGVTAGATGLLTDGSTCYDFATALCYTNINNVLAYGTTDAHSLELWITFQSGASFPYLFSNSTPSDIGGTVIWLDGSSHMHYNGIDTGFIPTVGVTYHVVFTSAGKLYINGVQFYDNSVNWISGSLFLFNCYIGRPNNTVNGDSWKGKIEKVAWYTVPLTATQVATHYAAGNGVFSLTPSVTQEVVEVGITPPLAPSITQETLEVGIRPALIPKITQEVLEVGILVPQPLRPSVTQEVLEVAVVPALFPSVDQEVLEVAYFLPLPAITYTFTGPTTLTAGINGTYFLTGSGTTASAITISDGGAGGTITTSPTNLNNTSSVAFTYSNPFAGTYTLTTTNSVGMSDPSPITVVVSSAGGGSITVMGNLSRADYVYPYPSTGPGTPRKQQKLSAVYTKAIPRVTTTCVCSGTPVTVDVDNEANVMQTTTDCSGNFTFTFPSDTNSFGITIDETIVNPAWGGGNCTDICGGIPQFIIDPLSDPRGNDDGRTINLIDGCSPINHIFDLPNMWYQTPTMGGAFGTVFGHPNRLPITTTAATLNINVGGGGGFATQTGAIHVIVKKGSKYYQVNNASITITDSCGATNTATGGAIPFGGPTWTDWKLWDSLTINSGIPPDCGYDTNPNLTLLTPLPPTDYTTTGTTLPTITQPYFTNFRWDIVIQECPDSAKSLIADTNNGVIAVVWSNDTSVLLARHLNPSGNIGSGTSGWEANQTISGTIPSPGCIYLAGDDLMVFAGQAHVSHSAGAPGTFAVAPFTPITRANGSVGRCVRSAFQFGITTFNPIAPTITGSILFGQYVKPDGSGALGSTVDNACIGPRVGGIWNGDGWTALATIVVAGVEGNYYYTSSNGSGWSSRTALTSITGRICSVVKGQSNNCFVGLTYSMANFKCRAIRSYDGGYTWEQDTVDIAAIPATITPPMLVPMQDGVYAVWQIADVPNFAFSGDAGKTWT